MATKTNTSNASIIGVALAAATGGYVAWNIHQHQKQRITRHQNKYIHSWLRMDEGMMQLQSVQDHQNKQYLEDYFSSHKKEQVIQIPLPQTSFLHPSENIPLYSNLTHIPLEIHLQAKTNNIFVSLDTSTWMFNSQKENNSLVPFEIYETQPLLIENIQAPDSSLSSSHNSVFAFTAFHILNVENYWMPSKNFNLYLLYDFEWYNNQLNNNNHWQLRMKENSILIDIDQYQKVLSSSISKRKFQTLTTRLGSRHILNLELSCPWLYSSFKIHHDVLTKRVIFIQQSRANLDSDMWTTSPLKYWLPLNDGTKNDVNSSVLFLNASTLNQSFDIIHSIRLKSNNTPFQLLTTSQRATLLVIRKGCKYDMGREQFIDQGSIHTILLQDNEKDTCTILSNDKNLLYERYIILQPSNSNMKTTTNTTFVHVTDFPSLHCIIATLTYQSKTTLESYEIDQDLKRCTKQEEMLLLNTPTQNNELNIVHLTRSFVNQQYVIK